MNPYEYRILTTVDEMLPYYEIVVQMPYSFDRDQYATYLAGMIPNGYSQMVLLQEGKCVALAGFWINTKLYCGKYVELDNVIVPAGHRDKGAGGLLCRAIEKEAIRQECTTALLDAYVENHRAHRFYIREGYIIRGYHFLKKF